MSPKRLTWTDLGAVALLLAACVYAFAKPTWDWDVIPYLALARHWTDADWASVHAWVYSLIDGLPMAWRQDLAGRDAYRWTLTADSEALRQTVVFYQARIGYTLPLAGLALAGVPALLAVQLLNLLGQAVLGGTVWLWLRRLEMKVWVALPLFAFLLFNPTVMKLARWSSPDGLVAASFVLGAYLLLYRRDLWWVVAWAAMVMFKPNTVLLLAPVGVWAWVCFRPAVVPLLGLAFLGALLLWIWPNYPLGVLWLHSFAAPMPRPAEAGELPGAGFYARTLLARIGGLHGRDLLVWAAMAASTAVLALWKAPTRGFALAVLAGCAMQIAIFPAFWERYFAGPLVALVLLAVAAAAQRRPAG